MSLRRITRIPKRLSDDLKIIRLVENWKDIISAKLSQKPLKTVQLRNGVVLNSPDEVDLNFLFHEIWINEFYAPAGYDIRAGETVVDIGANIGVFATYAATKAPDVKVLSFEPFPQNAEFFRQNITDSGLTNVYFQMAAVADSNGKRALHVDDSWILHSLIDQNSPEDGIEVDCLSLDEILAKEPKCELLKLDCEGGEYQVLFAASDETLAKIKRIVCEFNILDTVQRNGEGLRAFLFEKGFIVDSLTSLNPTSGFLCARRNEE